MGTSWSAIVWAGFIASILAASGFWVFRTFEWTRFSPGTQLGCLILRDPALPATETVGFLLFVGLGSTVVAALYALFMAAAGGAGWGTGSLAGVLHGAGTVAALPLLVHVSGCVKEGRLPPPGRFGLGWGRATPVAVVAGHVVYGAIFGGVLGAF